MLKDFISKLPLDVIIKTELENNRVFLPSKIDPAAFYKEHKSEVNQNSLTEEKALYLAAMHEPKKYIPAETILMKRLNQR